MNKPVKYPPRKKKFERGARGLIAEAKDFRGGTLDGDYLDSRLARELQRQLTASEYEYFIVRRDDPEPHRGPWKESDVDQWLEEWYEEGGGSGVFFKARRTVGHIEKIQS